MHWVNEYAALILPLVALAFTGVGYLLKRLLTGESHRENAESIERAVQLKRLLDAEGLSLEEAIALRNQMNERRGAYLEAKVHAAVSREREELELPAWERAERDQPFPFEDTTLGMGAKVHADLGKLESEMEYLIAKMSHSCSEARELALKKSQRAWQVFCDREAEFAGLLFEGGTGAPLLGAARKLALMEQRISDLQTSIAET